MRSSSCCYKTSFSCLAEKDSFPESNPAGAMGEHYHLGTETSGGLGAWDARGCCGAVVWSPSHRDS